MIIATKRKIITITWTAEQAADAEVRLFNQLIAFFYKKGITPDQMKLKIDSICGCIEAETDCNTILRDGSQ